MGTMRWAIDPKGAGMDWTPTDEDERRTFVDSNGCRRVYSDLTESNKYATESGAERGAIKTLRHSSPYYVWELEDGLFDWSAIPEPQTPGYPALRLVSQGVTPPGVKRRRG